MVLAWAALIVIVVLAGWASADEPATKALMTWSGGAKAEHRVYGLTLGDRRERSGVGLRILAKRGHGTGKASFDSLQVINCGVAVSIDNSHWHGNGDVLTYPGVFRPEFCEVGYRVANEQNMGHFFSTVWPYGTETVFDFDRGGDLHVSDIVVTHRTKTILRTGRTGRNNGSFNLGTIKQDRQVTGCVWIDATQPTLARFIIEAASMGGSHRRGEALVRLYGPQTLVASNVHQFAAGNIVCREKPRRGRAPDVPSVTLRDCVLADDIEDIVTGRARVKLDGCRRPDGAFVPDRVFEVGKDPAIETIGPSRQKDIAA